MSTFCPRHGRRSDPTAVEIPGLRCDCPEVIDPGGLKKGKWATAPLRMWVPGVAADVGIAKAVLDVQDRVGMAVAEALEAGYDLGLQGGERPKYVHTCVTCRAVWVPVQGATDISDTQCLACWAKGRE